MLCTGEERYERGWWMCAESTDTTRQTETKWGGAADVMAALRGGEEMKVRQSAHSCDMSLQHNPSPSSHRRKSSTSENSALRAHTG